MSTVKSKKLQVGTDATSTNNFTIYQPSTPDGTLRIGQGTADNPTEVGRFNSNGYIAANAPSFRATMSANQAISATTWTKMNFNTEGWDTTSDYDTSAYKFTPSVSGYYMVTLKKQWTATGGGLVALYRNGVGHMWGTYPTSNNYTSILTGIVYLNGTTDNIEPYGYRTTSGTINSNAATTYFQAILIHAT